MAAPPPRSPRAWIFQATPQTLDLASELVSGERLEWSIARYAREVQPDDRVYYWQAGRDAGIYGLGQIAESPRLTSGRRYRVVTVHDHLLFAPLSRADLRADPELATLAVLRQPRGTVFPLTPEQEQALARRLGAPPPVLLLPRTARRGRTVHLASEDSDLLARLAAQYERPDPLLVLLVDRAGAVVERATVTTLRARDETTLGLRLSQPTPSQAIVLPESLGAAVAAGRPALLPLPLPADRPPPRAVAEHRAPYRTASAFAPPWSDLRGSLLLPDALLEQAVAAINAGHHLVLMGAPGTGKTTLAQNLAAAAARAGLCAGSLLATATADWTTFDTVGGLVPGADGALHFAEGVALRAFRENRWLVLDELNRADIDRAFGPLLTVLSGGPVDLPTVSVAGRPLRIVPGAAATGRSSDAATYEVGAQWRLIATMNTLDRAALYRFSLAFARRFAFLLVPQPAVESLLTLIQERTGLGAADLAALRATLEATPVPLGPALLLDAAHYIAARGTPQALGEALGAFILPQFDGQDPGAVRAFSARVAPLLDEGSGAVLSGYLGAFFGAEGRSGG